MPDWLPLYAVLWGLYLIEHVLWQPAGSVAFSGRSEGICRPAPASPDMDARQGRLVLANPFDLYGATFLSARAPLGRLDTEAIARRAACYRRAVPRLRRAEAALRIHLLVVVPIVWQTIGILRAWPFLLGGLVVLHAATLVLFHRAHRLLHPDADERWSRLIPLILAPPAAASARLALAKHLFRDDHPLAVGAVLCGDGAFRMLALPYLRWSLYPLAGDVAPDGGGESDRGLIEPEAVRALIARKLGREATALQEPIKRSPHARSYCPRCQSEYLEASRECADCPGVQVVAFGSAQSAS